MWCDDSRLREELVKCQIGSFVQVHIETAFNDLIRIDLQAALQRSIDTLHLPVKTLQDDQVMMKVFVPHGSRATRALPIRVLRNLRIGNPH